MRFNDFLEHHGVKGQKWGVRRYQNPDGTHTPLGRKLDRMRNQKPSGKGYQNEDGSLNKRGMKRYSRIVGSKDGLTVAERNGRTKGMYEFLDKDSKRVGQAIIDDEGSNNHLDWIGVGSKHRRQGYGQKALDILIEDSKKQGKKTITLEAAGLDDAAFHIYSKKGFKALETMDSDIWNGLIKMEKKL